MTSDNQWLVGDDGELPYSPQPERKTKRGLASAYLTAQFIEQLEALVDAYEKVRSGSAYKDLSDLNALDIHALLTRSRAAIERITDPKSVYAHHAKSLLTHGLWDGGKLIAMMGIVGALRTDLEAGYMESYAETIRADTYADFLEMAAGLADVANTQAVVVLVGSVLVEHLLKLAAKYAVTAERSNSERAFLIDNARLNTALAQHGIYSKLDQDSVARWLDLWATALSDRHDEYGKEQALLMLEGVRDFLNKYPA